MTAATGMSGDYIFDFQEEINRLRTDFPKESAKVTFVDLAALPALAEVKEWLAQKSGMAANGSFATPEALGAAVDQLAARLVFQNGTGFSCAFLGKDGPALVAAPSYTTRNALGFGDRHKEAIFTLYHEFGHAVVEGAAYDDIRSAPKDPLAKAHADKAQEDRADSLAAMMCISRGILTPDEVRGLAERRALQSLFTKDLAHMTTEALARVALRAESADFISLSPPELRALADAHARDCARDIGALRAVEKTFSKFAQEQEHIFRHVRLKMSRETHGGALDVVAQDKPAQDSLHRHFSSPLKKLAGLFNLRAQKSYPDLIAGSLLQASRQTPKTLPENNSWSFG